MPARSPQRAATLLALAVPLFLTGCSLRSLAVNELADTLAGSGGSFAADDDPELVRDAVPFALKTMEMLLAEEPGHVGLRVAACRGFTQYGYAFVELEAERVEEVDYFRSLELYERALKLYLRGRDHCLAGLEEEHPGITERLRLDPEAAAAELGAGDVEIAYWTALSWGAALSAGKDRPELLGDLGTVEALLRRVLALDEAYDRGGVHEAIMLVETSGSLVGGSTESAEKHYRRAVELSGGVKASPFVSYAEAVALQNQDREAFVEALERALEVDADRVPELELTNVLLQEKARWLLERVDDYFLDDVPVDEPAEGTR